MAEIDANKSQLDMLPTDYNYRPDRYYRNLNKADLHQLMHHLVWGPDDHGEEDSITLPTPNNDRPSGEWHELPKLTDNIRLIGRTALEASLANAA